MPGQKGVSLLAKMAELAQDNVKSIGELIRLLHHNSTMGSNLNTADVKTLSGPGLRPKRMSSDYLGILESGLVCSEASELSVGNKRHLVQPPSSLTRCDKLLKY
jgi:hypothetical protein